jgi:dsRNA-specific ribonuclease
MTATQLGFLRAVIEGETAFTSQKNLKKYRLGTSANLTKIKNALISREIIDIIAEKVDILDPIFELWLKEEYFKVVV